MRGGVDFLIDPPAELRQLNTGTVPQLTVLREEHNGMFQQVCHG
jgi:hypothetical protein